MFSLPERPLRDQKIVETVDRHFVKVTYAVCDDLQLLPINMIAPETARFVRHRTYKLLQMIVLASFEEDLQLSTAIAPVLEAFQDSLDKFDHLDDPHAERFGFRSLVESYVLGALLECRDGTQAQATSHVVKRR